MFPLFSRTQTWVATPILSSLASNGISSPNFRYGSFAWQFFELATGFIEANLFLVAVRPITANGCPRIKDASVASHLPFRCDQRIRQGSADNDQASRKDIPEPARGAQGLCSSYLVYIHKYPPSLMVNVLPDHDPVVVNAPSVETNVNEPPDFFITPLSEIVVVPLATSTTAVWLYVLSLFRVTDAEWKTTSSPPMEIMTGSSIPSTVCSVYVPLIGLGAVESPPQARTPHNTARAAIARNIFMKVTRLKGSHNLACRNLSRNRMNPHSHFRRPYQISRYAMSAAARIPNQTQIGVFCTDTEYSYG